MTDARGRRAAAALVLAFCGLAAAAQARPDVRILDDSDVRLRAAAAATSRIVRKMERLEPLLVLERDSKVWTLDGKKGNWYKVRTSGGEEGWVFGPYLREAKGSFLRSDFDSDARYSSYLALALRKGERVRAAGDFEKVRKGEVGSFFARADDSPPYLIVWDRDLEATPDEGALGSEFPRILSSRAYFVEAPAIEIVGTAKVADFSSEALDQARRMAGAFSAGTAVVLGRHLRVTADPDSDNWNPDMDRYVGMTAVIADSPGDDSYGRPAASVDVDGGEFLWRIENMTLEAGAQETPSAGSGAASASDDDGSSLSTAEGYGKVAVGSMVVLGRHDPASGDANWNDSMDEYVGTTAKVTELSGADSAGFLGVRVEGNDWFWRVRNLALVGSGEPGSYGFAVGDKVVLGKHRKVAGEADWSDEMESFVGKTATITSLNGTEGDPAACFTVNVDVDGGAWYWRAENLRIAK